MAKAEKNSKNLLYINKYTYAKQFLALKINIISILSTIVI